MPNWNSIAKTVKRAIQVNGNLAAVTLRDGTQFTLPVAHGKPRSSDLTEGIEQQRDRCTVSSLEWADKAPRAPEKGDQLIVNGRRYAFSETKQHVQGDVSQVYRFFLEG